MTQLANKNVLITGAASGMGLEMARQFTHERAKLLLVDVNGPGVEKAAGEIGAKAFTCDLREPKQIRALKEKVARDVGEIDVLINNAGVVSGGAFDEISEAKDQLTLDVNVAAVHWMTKAFLPDMKKKRAGHIVNMASAAGIVAVPKMVAYCASKSWVIGFSEALRAELAQDGLSEIRVTVVCPSYVDTGMFAGVRAPLFTPLLKPGFVAHRILEAVKHDEDAVREPFIVKATPVLKALLPPGMFGRISERLGVSRSMHSWTGRT